MKDDPNLLATGGRALARTLRWVFLVATIFLLVYLVQVGRGPRGMTLSFGMTLVAAVLGVLVAAALTWLFSSTRPRNRILRTASPVLALVGVALLLTSDPEGAARRYFDDHRSELDGLVRELRADRPFTGSLRGSAFEGKERLNRRLADLGVRDVHLYGSRTVFVHSLDLDHLHGFVQVPEEFQPPRRGEAFFPESASYSYQYVRPLDGRWYYYRAGDLPATTPTGSSPDAPPSAAPSTSDPDAPASADTAAATP